MVNSCGVGFSWDSSSRSELRRNRERFAAAARRSIAPNGYCGRLWLHKGDSSKWWTPQAQSVGVRRLLAIGRERRAASVVRRQRAARSPATADRLVAANDVKLDSQAGAC